MSYFKALFRYLSGQIKTRKYQKLAQLISQPDTSWIQDQSVTTTPVCSVRLMGMVMHVEMVTMYMP
jgi:hypothetical protein